jgi:thiol-disulfide isomerase/thioredoxin
MIIRYIYIFSFISFLLFSCKNPNKNKIEVVNFDELYKSIDLSSNNTYVINFWATWCRPCVKELPYFEYVNDQYSDKNVKVFLVSLDFPSQIESKIKPYIFTKKIRSKVLLLDDPDLITWIPKVSDKWGGGIPATLIVNRSNYNFYPNPFNQESLVNEINKVLD